MWNEATSSPTKTRVASFERWAGHREEVASQTHASAEESVGITLTEQIFVERGYIITHKDQVPVLTNAFRARVFWLGDSPLQVGSRYKLKLNTAEHSVEVAEIEQVMSTEDLSRTSVDRVEKYGVAEIIMRSRSLVALDESAANPVTGRFVLLEGYRIAGGGIVNLEGFATQRRDFTVRSTNLHPIDARINPLQRGITNGHLGGVLWFTGLPSSGKTTLALELQRELFERGYQVFVLDADNIRSRINADLGFEAQDRTENIRRVGEIAALFADAGMVVITTFISGYQVFVLDADNIRSRINADLGFEAQDRTENIRRVGEIAALFADAGMVVITTFISPYSDDRERARVASNNRFHCFYIEADVATCEERDPYGLWKKVRRGEIQNFTGVDAPYEVPETPDLVINTGDHSIDDCLTQLVEYVRTHLVVPVRQENFSRRIPDCRQIVPNILIPT